MARDINLSNIIIPEAPIEANYGEWLTNHPRCNSVIEQIGTGPTVLVFAYAKSSIGNHELKNYRNEFLPDKEILIGLTEDAINSLV